MTDNTDATPAPLPACPLCGEQRGYALGYSDSFRWWQVTCAACVQAVADCRSDMRTDIGRTLPESWPPADAAWREAAAHAEGLRAEIARLRALATCGCGDVFTPADPGTCGACVAGMGRADLAGVLADRDTMVPAGQSATAVQLAQQMDADCALIGWDEVPAMLRAQAEALQEADRIMGHDDAATGWRERWAHLWPVEPVPSGAGEPS